ncbi:hypothetical protein Hypma_001213 [Hypsizygus marmoreus]|uniref:Uncharacterized protein n=1 Tax=Hypsizygus marmoreus TaxID=39966 RepID=A0A369J6G4_HYPMA|nr:hypothetical protein Hypma_001213 [Hypsizygus marmoreus]
MGNFGTQVVLANGDVQRDTCHGISYFQSPLFTCNAGAVIPDNSTMTLISTVPSTYSKLLCEPFPRRSPRRRQSSRL